MDANTAFAVYALAALVFALPVFIAGVFAVGIVKAVIFVVKAVASHFAKPATIEIITPIKTVAIPAGMSFEEFDAWLETAFAEEA